MRMPLRLLACAVLLTSLSWCQLPQAPTNPPPDDRYKADILLVVGHPDDDIEVAAYLAKEIEQQHKRVAVVYGTRGNSGGNGAGQEQAAALADVREMESRKSLASYGVTNAWFLRGSDTASQDVLHSLETWHHGAALEEMVRLVRLTRPEVILTWMPNFVVGENHGDHQAAGVIATEAFDLAANPVIFPEQVNPPRNYSTINNYGEGLRPWQPKKIYYFSDSLRFDFYKGNGPEYHTSDVSPAKGVPYSKIAADAWRYYKTQADFTEQQLKEFTEMPVRLIFGKSLVGGSPTSDVFEGITAAPINYVRPRGYQPEARQGVSLELGGPWAFYHRFRTAHNVEHIESLFPAEAGIAPGDKLLLPLLIHNDTDSPKQVTLRATLPAGWKQEPGDQVYPVRAHDTYPVQLAINPPDGQKGWQNLTWTAESDGQKAGPVTLRVNAGSNVMPQ